MKNYSKKIIEPFFNYEAFKIVMPYARFNPLIKHIFSIKLNATNFPQD